MTVTEESIRGLSRRVVERVSCRAYLSASQLNLTGNSFNKINLNSVSHDLGVNFDTANYKFTAPVSGLYTIFGSVYFVGTSVIADYAYKVALYKNGVAITQSSSTASLADEISVGVYDKIYLTKDDYIELYANPMVGVGTDTVDVLGGAKYTYLVVSLVTKEGIRQ